MAYRVGRSSGKSGSLIRLLFDNREEGAVCHNHLHISCIGGIAPIRDYSRKYAKLYFLEFP